MVLHISFGVKALVAARIRAQELSSRLMGSHMNQKVCALSKGARTASMVTYKRLCTLVHVHMGCASVSSAELHLTSWILAWVPARFLTPANSRTPFSLSEGHRLFSRV